MNSDLFFDFLDDLTPRGQSGNEEAIVVERLTEVLHAGKPLEQVVDCDEEILRLFRIDGADTEDGDSIHSISASTYVPDTPLPDTPISGSDSIFQPLIFDSFGYVSDSQCTDSLTPPTPDGLSSVCDENVEQCAGISFKRSASTLDLLGHETDRISFVTPAKRARRSYRVPSSPQRSPSPIMSMAPACTCVIATPPLEEDCYGLDPDAAAMAIKLAISTSLEKLASVPLDNKARCTTRLTRKVFVEHNPDTDEPVPVLKYEETKVARDLSRSPEFMYENSSKSQEGMKSPPCTANHHSPYNPSRIRLGDSPSTPGIMTRSRSAHVRTVTPPSVPLFRASASLPVKEHYSDSSNYGSYGVYSRHRLPAPSRADGLGVKFLEHFSQPDSREPPAVEIASLNASSAKRISIAGF
eukprot:CAMPEP_0184643768 /NCGR_PEP_ID=MMETSP0308-20130426/593_1 /TAXON_ID=38269 /ORGANISM="Gloeochaete witrockiana, Strain SAG 46.84" /LENGTH=410 /DNA_ID=CAMNT_0027071933 /DNA_START=70 /DNA_END=1302 /DNA_ORIENTATION=+